MKLRPIHRVCVFVITVTVRAADDTPPSTSPPTPISVRAAIAAPFKYQPSEKAPAEKPATSPVILSSVAAEPPVVMKPYVVGDTRDRPILKAVDSAIAQEKSLEVPAAFKVNINKRVELDIFRSPIPTSAGGIALPIISLRW